MITKFISSDLGKSLWMGWGKNIAGNVLIIELNGRFVGIHCILCYNTHATTIFCMYKI